MDPATRNPEIRRLINTVVCQINEINRAIKTYDQSVVRPYLVSANLFPENIIITRCANVKVEFLVQLYKDLEIRVKRLKEILIKYNVPLEHINGLEYIP